MKPGVPHKNKGTNTNDIGHLGVAYHALEEVKAVRALGIYTYRPGDGEVKGVTGGMNDDPDDPWRHGLGLMTVAKVSKAIFAKGEDISFTFPYASHDTELLDAVWYLGGSPQAHGRGPTTWPQSFAMC